MPEPERCPCGRPLHYLDPEMESAVRHLVEELGPLVSIVSNEGVWRVPRHYIALHGVRATAIPHLAARYGWEKQ